MDYIPILEDQVKTAMAEYLRRNGYQAVNAQLGTRQGYDVEGVNPETGIRLVIECKGEAKRGSQHHRSWPNVASAILTSLNERYTEGNKNEVAIGLPDTKEYRERMSRLKDFFQQEKIQVFWVSGNNEVVRW